MRNGPRGMLCVLINVDESHAHAVSYQNVVFFRLP